ncbi:MAG TPA: response regulator [Planctomycetota bacterium]
MDRPLRILVTDDDAPTRRLLSAALTSEGLYEVITARSVTEALEVLRCSPGFDVIVTDLCMPQQSGLDLVKQVRALSHTMPILILTSVQSDQSLAQALEAGADDYLQKPVDLRELRTAVGYLMEKRRKAEANRPVDADGVPVAPAAHTIRNIDEGTFVECTSLSDPAVAERFQRFAERVLSTCLGTKERGDLRLALEEIVHNAIEWGNANDPTKRLRLSYCRLPDRITFRVEDEGSGFNPGVLKDPSVNPQRHIQERRCSGKRMGGWGIFLARKMVDEVTFNRKGNVVFLTKYLHRTAPATETVPAEALAAESAQEPEASPSAPGALQPEAPTRRTTRLLRKTTRLLRKEDPRVHG